MEEAFVKKTISTDLFLDKISAKAIGNETMLSWITLAVLSSSPGILRAMAELFEFRLDFTKSIEVEREYPLGDGYRVDLAFLQDAGKVVYLLENKIYDQDYHFSTYQNSPVGKTASGLALVAAHKVSEKHPPGWKVVTWSDVVRKLRSTGLEESGLIGEAFCKYIERVCQMPIIERVDLANAHLQSLYYMYNLFLKIIQDYSHSDYFCKVYSAGRSFGPGRMGQHFQITVGEKSVYPWFGIMFSDVQPKISILFENDWCPQMVQAEFPKPRPDLYEVKKQEGKYIVFSQHRFEEFSRADKEAQEQLLVSFFRTVVDQIPDVLRR